MPLEWQGELQSAVAVWVRHPGILFNRGGENFSSNFLLIILSYKDAVSDHSSSHDSQLIWMGEGSSGKSGGIQRFAMSLNKPLHMPMSLGSDGDSGFGWAAFRVRLIFYLPKTTYLVYYNSLGCPNNHQKKRSVPPGDNSSCPRGVTKKG